MHLVVNGAFLTQPSGDISGFTHLRGVALQPVPRPLPSALSSRWLFTLRGCVSVPALAPRSQNVVFVSPPVDWPALLKRTADQLQSNHFLKSGSAAFSAPFLQCAHWQRVGHCGKKRILPLIQSLRSTDKDFSHFPCVSSHQLGTFFSFGDVRADTLGTNPGELSKGNCSLWATRCVGDL